MARGNNFHFVTLLEESASEFDTVCRELLSFNIASANKRNM